jgi:hypothetical protein
MTLAAARERMVSGCGMRGLYDISPRKRWRIALTAALTDK